MGQHATTQTKNSPPLLKQGLSLPEKRQSIFPSDFTNKVISTVEVDTDKQPHRQTATPIAAVRRGAKFQAHL